MFGSIMLLRGAYGKVYNALSKSENKFYALIYKFCWLTRWGILILSSLLLDFFKVN